MNPEACDFCHELPHDDDDPVLVVEQGGALAHPACADPRIAEQAP